MTVLCMAVERRVQHCQILLEWKIPLSFFNDQDYQELPDVVQTIYLRPIYPYSSYKTALIHESFVQCSFGCHCRSNSAAVIIIYFIKTNLKNKHIWSNLSILIKQTYNYTTYHLGVKDICTKMVNLS